MIIAVASGKGGTGKTTVATSLARAIQAQYYLDCDVETPNAHIFLHPELNHHDEVTLLIPQIDQEKCVGCGRCAEVCQYHAIVMIAEKPIVFPELCHGCGSCVLNCPHSAIREIPRNVGKLEGGPAVDDIQFARGLLNIGEPLAVPIISQLKKWLPVEATDIVIRDAPPGTSCPVVETVQGADYVVLVTEPTPFGLHDLKLAVQVVQELKIPAGVIINRYHGLDASGVEEFCGLEGLPVLMKIPFKRSIAEGIARGQSLLEIDAEYHERFQDVYDHIRNNIH